MNRRVSKEGRAMPGRPLRLGYSHYPLHPIWTEGRLRQRGLGADEHPVTNVGQILVLLQLALETSNSVLLP